MMTVNSYRDFDMFKRNFLTRGDEFTIIEKGKQKSLQINGKLEVSYKQKNNSLSQYLRNPKYLNIIRIVHAEVNRYIVSNNFNIAPVEPVNKAILLKNSLYRQYPDGSYFYLIDIKHAYWRFAYLLGYIKYETYKKYKDAKEYKLARNIALSTLVSKKQKQYYSNGKLINEIRCVNDYSALMYKNIRYSTYNMVGKIELILGDKCLAYRVDGVMVTGDAIPIVRQFLRNNKLTGDIIECQKENDSQYLIISTGKLKNL